MDHQQYVDAMKSTAQTVIKKGLIKYALTKFPFLIGGPLGPLLAFVAGKIAEIIVVKTEFGLFMKYIDMRTDSQGRLLSQAIIRNHEAQINGTQAEKEESEKILIEKFREFVILGS